MSNYRCACRLGPAVRDGKCALCLAPGERVPGGGKVCGDFLWLPRYAGAQVALVRLASCNEDGDPLVEVGEYCQGVYERTRHVRPRALVPWSRGWLVVDTEGNAHWWQACWDSSD